MKNCIIILNYNDYKTTINLVEMIKEYKSLNHIVIVDNSSSNNSYNVLKMYQNEKIDVISTPENKGYASGNNWGARYANQKYKPDILYFANPDIKISDETLLELNKTFMEDTYDLIAPLVENGTNVWRRPTCFGVIISMFLIVHNIDKILIKSKLKKTNTLQKVEVVEGSFFGIRNDVFCDIQGFDEKTFLYYEENILCARLVKKGYSSAVRSDLRYQHEHSKTIKSIYKSKANAFRLYKNSYDVYVDNYLNVGRASKKMVNIAFELALYERKIYDLLKKNYSR